MSSWPLGWAWEMPRFVLGTPGVGAGVVVAFGSQVNEL